VEQDSVWCGGLVDCWPKVHSSSIGFDPVIVGVKALLGEGESLLVVLCDLLCGCVFCGFGVLLCCVVVSWCLIAWLIHRE
jgi:hypothetical protein